MPFGRVCAPHFPCASPPFPHPPSVILQRLVFHICLICLALADDRGRITQKPATDHEAFLYERLEFFKELMAQPYVMGRDLIEAGLKPGAEFAEILAYAHKLRLAGIPKESALKQTLAYARKLMRS